MTWPIKRVKNILHAIMLAVLLLVTNGCEVFPESSFRLAESSRLPHWISLPSGMTRANISLTMTYYIKPSGRIAKFILRDANKQLRLRESGKLECLAPFKLKSFSQGSPADYPAYEAVTVNGVTDIIEHKKMEPIFYMTDDPAIWKQYKATGCD